jgi:hypothetical protein
MNATNNNSLPASASKHAARRAINSHRQSARLAPLAALLMLAFGHGVANAAQIEQAPSYTCVSVEGASTAPGTPVVAAPCAGFFDQQWNYVRGQLQGIGTTGAVNMCLNITGGSENVVPGTRVDLYTCSSSDSNQQWWIVTGQYFNSGISVNYNLIYNPASKLCLDSAGPENAGAPQLIVNVCTDSATQNWLVI